MAKTDTEKPVKYFDDQFDDEEVLLVFKKHPVVMRKGLILAMVALLLGTVPALIKPEFTYFYGGLAAGTILAAILFLPSWITWNFSVFIFTDQRFIQVTQKGFFHKSVVDIGINQIQMVNYEVAGFQESLLGFGTIMIQTLIGDLVIHDVHHPAKIQKKIIQILRDKGVINVSRPQTQEEDSQVEEED